jgi:dienelactone hydrolase
MKPLAVYRCLLALSLAALATPGATPQAAAGDGELLGERPYRFPAYDEAYGYTRIDGSRDAIDKYWSRDEYERAVGDERFEFQKLLYRSDGLAVVAYVYKPRVTTEALPTIVFNRGSGVHSDIAPVLIPYFHRLASQGFVVIAPMYRQSDGGEGIDANGGDDVNDLLNLLPVIRALHFADAGNIFMTGESRGAMMVYQAIREGFPMRAAAVWGGYSDLQPLLDAQPGLFEYARKHWPGFTGDALPAEIARRSVLRWAEKITVPILLMHGESDGSVPVEHTYNLARELQANQRLYSLIVFADDNHLLQRNQEERDRAAVRWFRNYDSRAETARLRYLETEASERDINDVGYSLLRRGRYSDALAVFEIGTGRFPGSVNAHDSLAEALAQSGDYENAIAVYARAIELSTDIDETERLRESIATLERRQ